MAKAFKSAVAFKTALEARMRNRVRESGLPFQTLQLKFVIERLLARLFHTADVPWLLKGGFAMDLRYRPHARTTKDVDLSVLLATEEVSTDLRDRLQAAADNDLGDYIIFRVGELKFELTNAPGGGGRFPCEAVMLGKSYAKFHIDVGLGDVVSGKPEQLTGDDLLEFAGLAPAIVLAIPKAQQFAEKVHAYTFPWTDRLNTRTKDPWTDRLNTRTKDLVDLVLLIERGPPEADAIRAALSATFQTRHTHQLPTTLPLPPDHWKIDFPGMASEADLSRRLTISRRSRYSMASGESIRSVGLSPFVHIQPPPQPLIPFPNAVQKKFYWCPLASTKSLFECKLRLAQFRKGTVWHKSRGNGLRRSTYQPSTYQPHWLRARGQLA